MKVSKGQGECGARSCRRSPPPLSRRQLNISEISNNYYKKREDKKANKEEAYKREIATIFGEAKSKIEVKWAGETERV